MLRPQFPVEMIVATLDKTRHGRSASWRLLTMTILIILGCWSWWSRDGNTWGNFFTAPAKLCVWMPENAFFVSTTCTRSDNETSSLDCDKIFRVNLRHHHPAIVTCSSGWGRPSSLERQHHHPPNPPLCFESSILFTIFKSLVAKTPTKKNGKMMRTTTFSLGRTLPSCRFLFRLCHEPDLGSAAPHPPGAVGAHNCVIQLELKLSIFCFLCVSRIGNTQPNLRFFQCLCLSLVYLFNLPTVLEQYNMQWNDPEINDWYIQAYKSYTNPVSPNTKQYQFIVESSGLDGWMDGYPLDCYDY